MTRSDIKPMPEFFDRYINLVPDLELIPALQESLALIDTINSKKLEERADYKYAPDKWTIKHILQHLIDVERIFSYRAMLIARNDKSVTPGFDQQFLADNSNAGNRQLHAIIRELKVVRQSTIEMFTSFEQDVLVRTGLNWKHEMSVGAFGFCIAGHQAWHFNVIKEKYIQR